MERSGVVTAGLVILVALGGFALSMAAAADSSSRDTVVLENPSLQVSVRRDNGELQIHHKPTKEIWMGPRGRFCRVTLVPNDGRPKSGYDTDRAFLTVNQFQQIEVRDNKIRLTFSPYGYSTGSIDLRVEFRVSLSGNQVELGYRVIQQDPDWSIHSVQIVDEALPINGQEDYAIMPVYQGEIVPVGSCFSYRAKDRLRGVRTSDVVGTYSGGGSWNMAMFALVKGSSTVVLTWKDPNVEPGLEGTAGQIRSTVVLNRQADSLCLHFMEAAGYVEVAKYYRGVAKKSGFYLTFEDKIRRTPDLEKNLGALRFTVAPKWGRGKGEGWAAFISEGESRVDYTFDEVAEVAEHLKQDLGIERGLVDVRAWTHRGYDMDYPDVLPAALECGGNAGLARASGRVRELGWLFGLHDNSLILFKSARSTDKRNALVREDGTAVEGGIGIPRWRLYACCPARMLKYAKNHYPIFKRIFGLNYVYSDQIAAMPLVECFSPDHPLTRRETIEAYGELIEFKRTHVGVVGSELADEWAVPIFDSMGLAVAQPLYDYGYPIPLFELVYRECVNLGTWPWGMLNDRWIFDSVSRGRIPYLPFPQRKYLEEGLDTEARGAYETWWLRGYSPNSIFLRGDQGWGRDLNWYDRLVKNVYEVASPLNLLTALVQMTDHEYLTDSRQVERVTFANGVTITANRGTSDFDCGEALLPNMGFLAAGPEFIAFYAKRYYDVQYPDGALFTIRALDGKPIADSRRVRVYHGFGRSKLRIGDLVLTVEREATLDPRGK
jgi:hypothetical protein